MDDGAGGLPLAVRVAEAACRFRWEDVPPAVTAKVKLCLFDLLSGAFESRDLPWSREAVAVASDGARPEGARGATIIGTSFVVPPGEAAFANAVMGHGLVREDMHAGAVSHLGVALLPAVMALAEQERVSGRDFIAAAAVGYEVGARLGLALMDRQITRYYRPTGITGPIAAAIAGARLMRLGVDGATSAIALAANMTGGLNEWAATGGSDMYFHPGQAARSGVTATRLAALGAFGAPAALDGPAGLFAAHGKIADPSIAELFVGKPEILAVYHKAAPVCNFAQTATQAALAIAADPDFDRQAISGITVRVPAAAAEYPGCALAGPFERTLQAKMSILFNVSAALRTGVAAESNFNLLRDAEVARLLRLITLETDETMTAAFPAKQGAEVEVRFANDTVLSHRLDDLAPATPEAVRLRFRESAREVVGGSRAAALEAFIDGLETVTDTGRLGALMATGRRSAA